MYRNSPSLSSIQHTLSLPHSFCCSKYQDTPSNGWRIQEHLQATSHSKSPYPSFFELELFFLSCARLAHKPVKQGLYTAYWYMFFWTYFTTPLQLHNTTTSPATTTTIMAHPNAQASLLIYPLPPITTLDKRDYSLDLLNQGPPRLSVYKPAKMATLAALCHPNSYFIVVLVINSLLFFPRLEHVFWRHHNCQRLPCIQRLMDIGRVQLSMSKKSGYSWVQKIV